MAWIVGSYLLRWVLTVTATDSRSIYGPLAAPIADPAVALPRRDRRADRRRRQRVVRHGLPAEGHDARAQPWSRPARGRVCSRVAGEQRGRGRRRSRPGLPARPQSAPRGGRSASGCSPRWRSWSAPCCWSTSTATATRQQRPDRRDQPGRLDLLHDGHAEHDRLRRHRAGRGPRPADQRLRHHPAPHRLPGPADRDHPRGARLAGPRAVPHRPLEEEHGTPRRRRRLRHQGPQRGRDPASTTARTASRSSSSTPAPTALPGRPRRRAGRRHRRRHPARGAAPRRRGRGRPGHHHHQPRRLQRAGHPHRPPAQPRRLHRRLGPRARERPADEAVRRQLGDHLLRRRRPAARASRRSPRPSAR